MINWPFLKKSERICGEEVDLLVNRKIKADAENHYIPSVLYHIVLHDTNQIVGNCDLRIGMDEELYYAGNIGYRIYPGYRGHHYAYQACLILFRLARQEYEMDELIITCSPDNPASKKTLQKLNGELLETTDVPAYHWLYKRGEPVKEIYRYDLRQE
ncbi:MAG: GNAT family N-acetyltransferase [Solobacterium sp.]|nr:GNAT family N-acetyltransferase [Erysipelotrichaceae bacterium]MBQ9154077.1 GNAT family N-acetyltransferase [Solobacterium sp.]